jgi:hypothetical protein
MNSVKSLVFPFVKTLSQVSHKSLEDQNVNLSQLIKYLSFYKVEIFVTFFTFLRGILLLSKV